METKKKSKRNFDIKKMKITKNYSILVSFKLICSKADSKADLIWSKLYGK